MAATDTNNVERADQAEQASLRNKLASFFGSATEKTKFAKAVSSHKNTNTWHHWLCHRKSLPFLNNYACFMGEWKITEDQKTAVVANGLLCATCGHVDPRMIYVLRKDLGKPSVTETKIPSSMGYTNPWVCVEPRQLYDEKPTYALNLDNGVIGKSFRVRD